MPSFVVHLLGRMFALFRRAAPAREDDATGSARACDLIFRLKAWPQLPENGRKADVYRMLSVMSSQPVNRRWLLARFRIPPQQLDELLRRFIAEGAVEVIDPAAYASA
jgi:hypothetical protein